MAYAAVDFGDRIWTEDLPGQSSLVKNAESQKDVDLKIERGEKEKLQGNELFKKGDLKGALRQYHVAKMYVGGLLNVSAEQKKKIDQLVLSILLNMGAVQVKQQNWDRTIDVCTEAIGIDADNVKALYRRGKAYLARNKVEQAKNDLVKAAKLAPNDREIQAEYNELRKKMQQESSREQTVYKAVVGQMFGGDNS